MEDELNLRTLLDRNAIIVCGNALTVLKRLPDNFAACCVTSPPYWGVRDYKLRGQIGIETTLQSYLRKLAAVFQELRRVLRPDGTLWLNIGDTYTSGNRGWRAPDRRNSARGMNNRPPTPPGLKDKELVGVPWRLAFRLQRQGWFLRSDVVWFKPNGQPESVKDRPSHAHEYVFLFANSKNYYYDQKAIVEPTNGGDGEKNRRSVWAINTHSTGGQHSETFPPELVRLCILAGSRPQNLVVDPFFGFGTVGLVSQETERRFFGVDINPQFVELARRRLALDDMALLRAGRVGFTAF